MWSYTRIVKTVHVFAMTPVRGSRKLLVVSKYRTLILGHARRSNSCKLYVVMFSNNTYLFRLHVRKRDQKKSFSKLLSLSFYIILFANYKVYFIEKYNLISLYNGIKYIVIKNKSESRNFSRWGPLADLYAIGLPSFSNHVPPITKKTKKKEKFP